MSLAKKTYSLLKIAAELQRRFNSEFQQTQALIKERVPLVVDNLIANRIIAPETKQAMIENLQHHDKCLLFIDKLASTARMNFGRPLGKRSTGEPVPFVNAKVPEDERESGRIFRELVLGRR